MHIQPFKNFSRIKNKCESYENKVKRYFPELQNSYKPISKKKLSPLFNRLVVS